MNSTKACWITLIAIGLLFPASNLAMAQGYYQRNVQRNPVTGRLEVVPAQNPNGRFVGPNRDYSDFYGTRFNPYTGTGSQTRVQRNPITGRLNVQNEYYNPWTGARLQSTTRFNPFTRRYETVDVVTPPGRLPADDQPVEPPQESSNGTTRPKPRVIETAPPPSLNPPEVEGQGGT